MSGKRIIAVFLCLMMLVSLAGCQSGDYKNAVSLTESGDWEGARELFASLGDYKDSAEQLRECDYRIALGKMGAGDYDGAIAILESLGSYSDASDQITECRYQKASGILKEKKWDEAAEAFAALGGYKDSADKVSECRYEIASSILEEGKWDEASEAFSALGGYKDSADKVLECSYRKAAELMSAQELDEAAEIFKGLNDYKDSADQYAECMYLKAVGLYENGEFEAAFTAFMDLEDYKDSDYYSVLSILQYDPQSFVDTVAGAMDLMFQAGNIPLSMTAVPPGSNSDARTFILDRQPSGREVYVSFSPSYSNGSVTNKGQISSIHVMGDAELAEDIETALSETLVASVLAMAALDDAASPEELTAVLGEAFGDMLSKFPAEIPETGHFEKVEIPYEHYKCEAAVSAWPNFYRFLFMISIPELVMQK